MLTYKDLYSYVVTEIEKRIPKESGTASTQASNNSSTVSGSVGIDNANILSGISTFLTDAIPSAILEGLEVTATTPESMSVNISAGKGIAAGKLYKMTADTRVNIPFDNDTPVFYINLNNNSLQVEKTQSKEKLTIAKIVTQTPGPIQTIYDVKDNNNNAYIVSFKEYKLYGVNDTFEEDSIELLRNNIGAILADNLIGNIRLSENLKIINSAGTLELNSDSLKMNTVSGNNLVTLDETGVYFNRADGVELAKFSTSGARIGNIEIYPSTIQSSNFITNVSGFQIQDDGNAEFNNVKLRGTLYSSYISENLYVNPGVTITGDMILNDDIWVKMNHKVGFNKDTNENTYWTQNSATNYLECWIDGAKRIEL